MSANPDTGSPGYVGCNQPIPLVKRYLCVKKLTVNDGFTNKSVKLPRAEARIFMGELRNRQVIPLVRLACSGYS